MLKLARRAQTNLPLDSGWEVIISLYQSIDTQQHTHHQPQPARALRKAGAKFVKDCFVRIFCPNLKQ